MKNILHFIGLSESEPKQLLQRFIAWATLITLVYLLSDLFVVLFLTFVLSYISLRIISNVTKKYGGKKIATVILFSFYVMMILLASTTIFPVLGQEIAELTQKIPTPNTAKKGADTVVTYYNQFIKGIVGQKQYQLWRTTQWYQYTQTQVKELSYSFFPRLFNFASSAAQYSLLFVFHLATAIALSFFVVFDYDNLAQKVTKLRDSNIENFYKHVAPDIYSFFRVLGQAFEAQAIIAVANTILTFLLIIALGLTNVLALSVLVFVGSFIPIFGLIISSAPILFLSFKIGGVSYISAAGIGIIIIHLFESYILNPQIYGYRMEIHPLFVLVVLLVGEHFFGLWGMVLGVPVFVYFWNEVLLANNKTG